MFDNAEQHPSFGMVGISHVSSTGTYLVGSEFKHQHFVTLKISHAEKHRDLSREWWFGKERIIEINLSEAQFVELMGRPNMGDGVPCTLDWIEGRRIEPPPPPVSMKEKYRGDLKADTAKCVKDLREATAELNAAIEEGRIGKTTLREIAKKLQYAAAAVDKGIPFVEESFEEAMEKTVNHAAAEIEATVTQTAIRLGIEQMKQMSASAPRLIGTAEGGQ